MYLWQLCKWQRLLHFCRFSGVTFCYWYVGGSFCNNYASGCFCCSYVVRSFCSTYAGDSFCSKYVGDNFYGNYADGSLLQLCRWYFLQCIMHMTVSIVIMQVTFFYSYVGDSFKEQFHILFSNWQPLSIKLTRKHSKALY